MVDNSGSMAGRLHRRPAYGGARTSSTCCSRVRGHRESQSRRGAVCGLGQRRCRPTSTRHGWTPPGSRPSISRISSSRRRGSNCAADGRRLGRLRGGAAVAARRDRQRADQKHAGQPVRADVQSRRARRRQRRRRFLWQQLSARLRRQLPGAAADVPGLQKQRQLHVLVAAAGAHPQGGAVARVQVSGRSVCSGAGPQLPVRQLRRSCRSPRTRVPPSP